MHNIVLGGLVFLFPIAAYCLFLAMINARQHPTLISGPWDFAGVLFATSGFLLVGGPSILGAFHARFRMALAQGQLPPLGWLTGDWSFWVLLWGLYFLLILGGALLVMRRRRLVTVIYNVEPSMLDEALGKVCGRLKLDSVRVANRLQLRLAPAESLLETADAIQSAPRLSSYVSSSAGVADLRANSQAELELEPFPALFNVTLRWRDVPDTLRRDVEAELGNQLREMTTPDNPAASWFLTIASCLFGGLFLGLVAFILFLMRR